MKATIHRLGRSDNEAGFALLWVLVAMMVVTLSGLTVHRIANDDRLIAENYEVETHALLAADGAMVEYMAMWLPGDEFDMYSEEQTDTEEDGTDDKIDEAMLEFYGADLEPRTLPYGPAEVTIDPKKVTESSWGDVWLVEGQARVEDIRGSRPNADRTLRVFARFAPPFVPVAAMSAPNGLQIAAGSEHFHVDGKRKGKCGDGDNVAPLTIPEGGLEGLANASKQHIKGGEIDSLTQSYQELMDTLGVDFDRIVNAAKLGSFSSRILIPDDVPDLESVDFDTLFPKGKTKSRTWPLVLVEGDAVLTSEVKGHGFLIVTGKLDVQNVKLDWKGVIMTGKELIVKGVDAHLHAKGVMLTGLDCTDQEIADGDCKNVFDGKHMGVKYNQCEAEAAWLQLMILRPLPGARHTRMF